MTVTPANDADWTHYDVADLDGKVTVSALKNDVNIDARSSSSAAGQAVRAAPTAVTVREGEQKSREEKCGAANIRQAGSVPITQAILNSPYAIGAGLATIGVLTCWALCRSGNPISPTNPHP